MTLKHFSVLGVIILAILGVLVSLHEENKINMGGVEFGPRLLTPSKDNVSKRAMETIEHLRHIVENDPGDSRRIFELARFLQDAHNAQEASMYYARGLAIDAGNNAARIDYSLCLLELGRTNESLEQNMIVLRHDPRNVRACYNVGAIYANLGMYDSAQIYWFKVIAENSEEELVNRAKKNIDKISGSVITQ